MFKLTGIGDKQLPHQHKKSRIKTKIVLEKYGNFVLEEYCLKN